MENPVYAKNTLEFVTVAVEFCRFLEQADERTPAAFIDTGTKLLPLLYLKACLLPECETEETEETEKFVTEEVYEYIRNRIAALLGSRDTYLEVFQSDMQYSDTPITAAISEDLADIYQDVKDFVSVFRLGIERNMTAALCCCRENFSCYWGQKLVNVLRPLHAIRFADDADDRFENPGMPDDETDRASILARRMEEWKNDIDTEEWNNWHE